MAANGFAFVVKSLPQRVVAFAELDERFTAPPEFTTDDAFDIGDKNELLTMGGLVLTLFAAATPVPLRVDLQFVKLAGRAATLRGVSRRCGTPKASARASAMDSYRDELVPEDLLVPPMSSTAG